MSALRLINETVLTTAANKIELTNVFSEDFDIYCIAVNNTRAGTQRENNSMDMRLINSSGSEVTASIYDNEAMFARGFVASYLQIGGANRDDFALLYHDTSGQDGNGNMLMWIFNPYQSDRYTYSVHQTSGRMSYTGTTEIPYTSKGISVLKQKSRITGFSFTNRDSYDIASGTFRTFGLAVT